MLIAHKRTKGVGGFGWLMGQDVDVVWLIEGGGGGGHWWWCCCCRRCASHHRTKRVVNDVCVGAAGQNGFWVDQRWRRLIGERQLRCCVGWLDLRANGCWCVAVSTTSDVFPIADLRWLRRGHRWSGGCQLSPHRVSYRIQVGPRKTVARQQHVSDQRFNGGFADEPHKE